MLVIVYLHHFINSCNKLLFLLLMTNFNLYILHILSLKLVFQKHLILLHLWHFIKCMKNLSLTIYKKKTTTTNTTFYIIKVCNFFNSSATKFLAFFEWTFWYCFKLLFHIFTPLSNLFFPIHNINILLSHFVIIFSFIFIYVCL